MKTILFFSTNFISIRTTLKSRKKKSNFNVFVYLFFCSTENILIFFSLKREQGLLIEFNAFPQHIIDYLKLCIRDQHNDSPPVK